MDRLTTACAQTERERVGAADVARLARECERLVFVVHGAGVSRQFVPLLEAFLAELARKRLVVVVDAHHVDP